MLWIKRASVLAAVAAVSLMAGENVETFAGTVVDVQCGANCATYCPLVKGIRYTLQSGDEAFVLSDQKMAAPFSGKKVVVRGTLTVSNRLKVISIVPVSPSTPYAATAR
jgi:hypothetical protein